MIRRVEVCAAWLREAIAPDGTIRHVYRGISEEWMIAAVSVEYDWGHRSTSRRWAPIPKAFHLVVTNDFDTDLPEIMSNFTSWQYPNVVKNLEPIDVCGESRRISSYQEAAKLLQLAEESSE